MGQRVVPQGAAPERAHAIADLCKGFAPERIRQLGMKWVDWAVRSALPDHLDRAELHAAAEAVRGSAPIVGPLQIAEARACLGRIDLPNDNKLGVDLFASFYDLAASLEKLPLEQDVFECAFTAIMTSRMVYGDDRAVTMMVADVDANV